MFTSSAPLYNLQASVKQISISSSHSSLKSKVNSARFKVPVAEMKKLVLKLDLHSEKDKKKVMKAVSDIHGIDSISIDMDDKKLTITGAVDPVTVVAKLRKSWHTELLSVGPAKEEKKEEAKNKEGDKDKEKGKEKEKEKSKDDQIAEVVKAYQTYNAYYYVQSVEENPNACEIM